MADKKGIPKEILDQIDIRKKEKKEPLVVNVVVEEHQAKIPIPKRIRNHLHLKKGSKCKLILNRKKKELLCVF